MKVLITAVGQRTEHWTDLFALLARRPGLDLTVAVADVSDLTRQVMRRQAADLPGLRFEELPHLVGEERSGHMASILMSPGALRGVDLDNPDVIHVIGEPAYLSTWQVLGCRDRRWPTVPTTHYAAQNVLTRFPAPFPWLERRAYARVDHMFPITPSALDVLRRKGYSGPASVIPLGVDAGIFAPLALRRGGGRFTIGFVGRLEIHKGVRDLLQAAEILDADVLLVGRGSEAPLVEQAMARRPGRVTMLDWADHAELPSLLARMDVLVLPSWEIVQRNVLPWVGIPLREQFGRVLVEAMACGIPVVGSDVGEIPYVIGSAGLVFPAGNVTALAEQLGRLRNDPALAARLGRNGLARSAAEFSWDRVAVQMHAVWAELVSGPSSGVSDRERRDANRPVDRTNQEVVAEK